MNQPIKRQEWLVISPITFALAGSVYLYYRQLLLSSAQADPAGDWCTIIPGGNCDRYLSSDHLSWLDLSVTGWAIVYFSILLLLFLLRIFLREAFQTAAIVGSLVLTFFSGIGSLWLIGRFLLGNLPFCWLCLAVYGCNLFLFFMYWRMSPRPRRRLFTLLSAGGLYLLTGKTAEPIRSRWQLIAWLLVITFGVALFQRVQLESRVRNSQASPPVFTEEMYQTFLEEPRYDIPVSAADPYLGEPGASIQMVLFSDFECPYCAAFAEEIKSWIDLYEGQLQIVFKHYPLSSDCNPSMPDNLHPNACRAATAAQAAHLQGKFWPYHDALFNADLSAAALINIANQVGLDTTRFLTDLNQEEAYNKVLADVELANLLQVGGTPSVFINGRQCQDVQPQFLHLLIRAVLAGEKE